MITKHYLKIFAAVILFSWNYSTNAQIITGVVCDEITKKPIEDVHVYLNGTSSYAITNASGEFELSLKSEINTQLVLNHLLYKIASINNPFGKLPDTLFMQGRTYEISEITVSADRFSRKQKMKAFREQFLGRSSAAKSCKILNEDDIKLYFDMDTYTLMASSDKPLLVVNNYLGYEISFTLIDFWTQYNISAVDLENASVHKSFFTVFSSFTDITTPNNRKIKKRRDNIYELSSNNFFKCLASDALEENQFTLYNSGIPMDHRLYFTTKDTLTQKIITIIPNTDISKVTTTNPSSGMSIKMTSVNSDPELTGVISVIKRKKIRSDIYFTTDSFLVDRYGNIDKIDKITFSGSGQMGTFRAGDMLPIDYEP